MPNDEDERFNNEPYGDDEYDLSPRRERRLLNPPHSGLGVASFGLAIFNFLAACVVFLLFCVIEYAGFDPDTHDDLPFQLAAWFGSLLTLGSTLFGFGLGIGGACARDRKHVFAYLGMVFNVLILIAGTATLCIAIIAD
jgi:hypothetical protein